MSDGGAFGAEVVTPEGVAFSGPAAGVVLRTSEGDLTVLDGHTPLVGDVVPSVVRVLRIDGSTDAFVVHGGFLQVATERGAAVGLVEGASEEERSTRVTVLARVAEALGEVDPARATAARDRAQQALSALSGRDDEAAAIEREALEAALARAELRLAAAAA